MSAPQTLITDRLVLRQVAPRDWPGYRDFAATDRSRYVGGPATEGEAWRKFASILGHWVFLGYGMWAVTLKGDDTCLGVVGPWVPADWPETEIGWLLWPEAEGKGIGFEAARAVVDHAYGTLGWDTAVSYIDPDNARSIALAERLGAVLDPSAPQPKPDHAVLVYRHPRPTPATGGTDV